MVSIFRLIALGYIVFGMIAVIIVKVWLEIDDDGCLIVFFAWPFLLVVLIVLIPYWVALVIAEIINNRKKEE